MCRPTGEVVNEHPLICKGLLMDTWPGGLDLVVKAEEKDISPCPVGAPSGQY